MGNSDNSHVPTAFLIDAYTPTSTLGLVPLHQASKAATRTTGTAQHLPKLDHHSRRGALKYQGPPPFQISSYLRLWAPTLPWHVCSSKADSANDFEQAFVMTPNDPRHRRWILWSLSYPQETLTFRLQTHSSWDHLHHKNCMLHVYAIISKLATSSLL